MKASRIDKIKPKYDVYITVSTSSFSHSLGLDFARFPPAELIAEVAKEFDRPGFGFGLGLPAYGMIHATILSDPDPLKYGAYFPTHYEGLDIAKVVENICKEHGLTTEIKIAPSYQTQKEGEKIHDSN